MQVIKGIKKVMESDTFAPEIKLNSVSLAKVLLAASPKDFAAMLEDLDFGESLAAADAAILEARGAAEADSGGVAEVEALRRDLAAAAKL